MPGCEIASGAVGLRVAEWLAQNFPGWSLKAIARELGASHHTVKRWCSGERPANDAFDAMVARWGKAFVDHVYAPVIRPWRAESLAEEVADIRRRLARMENVLHERDPLDRPRMDQGEAALAPVAGAPACGAGRDMVAPVAAADGPRGQPR
ncbi:MAG: hypothetical protein AB7P02_23975 [Alphaproteobacteria bacterium]